MGGRIWFGVLLAVFAVFVAAGIFRKEYRMVYRNASIVCLSCIGID